MLIVYLFIHSCKVTSTSGNIQIGFGNKITMPDSNRYYSVTVINQKIVHIENIIKGIDSSIQKLNKEEMLLDSLKVGNKLTDTIYQEKKNELRIKKTNKIKDLERAKEIKKAWENVDKILKSKTSRYIKVSNGDELMSAIQNNTTITIKPGEYEISPIALKNVHGLTIIGEGKLPVHLVSKDLLQPVLKFDHCDTISLRNLKLGHRIIKPNNSEIFGGCGGPFVEDGAVVFLLQCLNIDIDSCYLYGCGTYGVHSDNSRNICVSFSHFYNCSYSAINMFQTEQSTIYSCIIYNNLNTKGSLFNLIDCNKLYFENIIVKDNSSDSLGHDNYLLGAYKSKQIYLSNCRIENNTFSQFSDNKEALTNDELVFNNNKWLPPVKQRARTVIYTPLIFDKH